MGKSRPTLHGCWDLPSQELKYSVHSLATHAFLGRVIVEECNVCTASIEHLSYRCVRLTMSHQKCTKYQPETDLFSPQVCHKITIMGVLTLLGRVKVTAAEVIQPFLWNCRGCYVINQQCMHDWLTKLLNKIDLSQFVTRCHFSPG